jgi:hypothetical protein
MTRYTVCLFSACLLLLNACSNTPADIEVKTDTDDPDVDVVRSIEVTGGNQCQLRIQKGRKDPELYVAKRCTLTRSGDFVSSVSLAFEAPCTEYRFNNLIGDKFFFDSKAITAPNKACAIESFNDSYGWSLVQN